ncbi:hypothetical protein [Streptomyces longispororuber]
MRPRPDTPGGNHRGVALLTRLGFEPVADFADCTRFPWSPA